MAVQPSVTAPSFDPGSTVDIVVIRTYMDGYTAAYIEVVCNIHTPDGNVWPDVFAISPVPPEAQDATNAGAQPVIGAALERYGLSQLWIPPGVSGSSSDAEGSETTA